MKIKNREALLASGIVVSRRILLDVAEETLKRLDAGVQMRKIMTRTGSVLKIGARSWDLAKKKHVYLLGAGKACNSMALAVEEVLGDYLTKGIVSVKISEPSDEFKRTKVYVGGHPLPNAEGEQAAMAMLSLIDGANEDDLFLCVVSGGSSALLSCPDEGITLEDEIRTTDVLLKSGANIKEINAVRRHISRVNGGRMAQRIQARGAEMIGFAIRDSLGQPPTAEITVPIADYNATQIGCDSTTIDDAWAMIEKYQLWDRLPASVSKYLRGLTRAMETPKTFPGVPYYIINTVVDSCMVATQVAEEMGIPSVILTSCLEGEAREIGKALSTIAHEVQQYGRPFVAPCLIISAGEVTVRIDGTERIAGHGGPSQEMAAGFAMLAGAVPGAAFLSIDSEGTDGTTMMAGGLTDSETLASAKGRGMNLYGMLIEHAAGEALASLFCAIETGNTGTNLCDLNLMYIPKLT